MYSPLKLINDLSVRKFVLFITAFTIGTNSIIIFTSLESRPLMIDITAVLTSGVALFLSGVVLFRKRKQKDLISLSVGLGFWFAAEAIWAFYRQGLGIEVPYPSVADWAWFAGYGFLALYTYRIIGKMAKTNPIEKSLVLLVSVSVALSLGYILNLTFGVTQYLSPPEEISALVFSVAYPVFDGILLVPSMVILWSLRKGDPSSSQWIMMSISFMVLTIGDIGFGYSFALAPSVAGEFEWIWALFYNTGYILIAAGIVWYSKLGKTNTFSSDIQNTESEFLVSK